MTVHIGQAFLQHSEQDQFGRFRKPGSSIDNVQVDINAAAFSESLYEPAERRVQARLVEKRGCNKCEIVRVSAMESSSSLMQSCRVGRGRVRRIGFRRSAAGFGKSERTSRPEAGRRLSASFAQRNRFFF